ncbi:MAG TPA: DUF192 domain-containing protein [Actinomycetota bacterium]|nr:DUF192 domain-containing protein [Actinomycetota bacterium]
MRRPVLLLVLGLTLTACLDDDPTVEAPASPTAPSRQPASVLSIGTESGQPATLHVEIADDDDERARGLMGVDDLPVDQGMAFVWDEPVDAAFWMKDTLIPLSIAFWDTEGRVIAILDMEPCAEDPCRTYAPEEPFVGAVEANLGWFADHGVQVGDAVELEERAYV